MIVDSEAGKDSRTLVRGAASDFARILQRLIIRAEGADPFEPRPQKCTRASIEIAQCDPVFGVRVATVRSDSAHVWYEYPSAVNSRAAIVRRGEKTVS